MLHCKRYQGVTPMTPPGHSTRLGLRTHAVVEEQVERNLGRDEQRDGVLDEGRVLRASIVWGAAATSTEL